MENSIKSVVGGITYVRHYFLPLSKALIVPFTIMLFLTLVLITSNLPKEAKTVISILQWIPLTLIAITTHKIILEGPDSVAEWGINRFGWRELKFTLCEILIVLFALPAAIFILIPYVGVFLFMLVAAYIIGRMSLVFPSIAIGERMDFKDSWIATKDHQLMMFSAVILFPLVIGAFEYFLSLVPGLSYLADFLSIFTVVLVVAALSVAYKIVIESSNVR